MKKAISIFLFASFTSLVAGASNRVLASPGDPKKEKDKQPTFTLSQGYFSLFNIFSTPAVDTARVATPVVVQQPQPLKKP
jgi:hypothetical protein